MQDRCGLQPKQDRLIEREACTGCGACIASCPADAISIELDKNGFCMPVIDEAKCISCGLCGATCQSRLSWRNKRITAFIGKNQDCQIQRQSTSGGIFTALAEETIKRGGVVFGAAFDEGLTVRHIMAETVEELSALRKSKYVESETGDTYRRAKELLDGNRWVLYSGTPCQIGGLLAYLGKRYDNLLCVDIICHGTPGQGIWKAYLDSLKGGNGQIEQFEFRDKSRGWSNMNSSYILRDENSRDGEKYILPSASDGYMQGFFNTEILRESCYHCDFRGEWGVSDITLGDCWGYDRLVGKAPDETGESVAVINTKRGAEAFEAVRDRLCVEKEIDVNELRKYNRNLFLNPSYTMKREAFFKRLEEDPGKAFSVFGEDVRSKMYVALLTEWLKDAVDGRDRATEFLCGRNYRKIAIYGMGTLGEIFYKTLNRPESEIQVLRCFDNNPPEHLKELCTAAQEIKKEDFCGVEAVIITPVHLKKNLSNFLRTYYDGAILGLDDIFTGGGC